MNAFHEITRYLDSYLRIRDVGDYAGAFNGLQLENTGEITKIGAAVDASGYTLNQAERRGIKLLLVHHGLFWGGQQPMIGGQYRLWKRAFAADVAVYSAHLPLDAHEELGNNVLLCRTLGFGEGVPAFATKNTLIGRRVSVMPEVGRDAVVDALARAVEGTVRVCPGGPERVQSIGVITGGAGAEARMAAAEGIDTFITGEGPHWTYALAEELGINILYGGHYATETFGVKALAAHLGERFGLPWEFIDHPTGL